MALNDSPYSRLLRELSSEPDQAALRFAQLRQRLVYFFSTRRLPFAEDLADEALDRCARRLDEGAPLHSTVEAFALGIARNLERELWKKPPTVPLPTHAASASQPASELSISLATCLDHCLDELNPAERQHILRFYTASGGEKIRLRQALAAELGIDPNALRVRMHRLRLRLESCVRSCAACNQSTSGAIQ